MTSDERGNTLDGRDEPTSSWLYDHIGRLTALALGVIVVAGLLWLAAIGFTPALALILFFVCGVLLIAGGGKIHRA